MANHTWYRPAIPLFPDDVETPLRLIEGGLLAGKVDVARLSSSAWLLRRSGREDRANPGLYLDDGALCWPHLPHPEGHWLLNCVGCILVRGLQADAMLEDEGVEGRFPADFDKTYPTLGSYLGRPTGSRLVDALSKVAGILGKRPDDTGLSMTGAPF